jgi:hypothetical protein
MARFTNLDGHLFGKLDLNGTLTGRGTELEDFVNSLTADGNINMKEGRLLNFDLINSIAEEFNFKTFDEEQLRDLTGDITVRDGHLVLDGAKVISQMGDWDDRRYYGSRRPSGVGRCQGDLPNG